MGVGGGDFDSSTSHSIVLTSHTDDLHVKVKYEKHVSTY